MGKKEREYSLSTGFSGGGLLGHENFRAQRRWKNRLSFEMWSALQRQAQRLAKELVEPSQIEERDWGFVVRGEEQAQV